MDMWKSIMSATCCLKWRFYEAPAANQSSTIVPCEPLLGRGQIRVGLWKSFRRGQQNQAAVEITGCQPGGSAVGFRLLARSNKRRASRPALPRGATYTDAGLYPSQNRWFIRNQVSIDSCSRDSTPCACMSTGPASCRNHSRSSSRSLPATVDPGAQDREIMHVLHKAFHCMARDTQDYN